MTVDAFMKHMMRDKKVLSGKLRLVLPTSIGSSEVVTGVSESVLAEVIEQCKA